MGNVPKLRFPQFSGEWEDTYLSTLINSLDAGVSVNSYDRSANINEKAILKTSCVSNGVFSVNENKVVIDNIEIQRLKENVKAETIIISRMNTPLLVGANAYVCKNYDNVFLPDRLWSAKIKQTASAKWTSFLLGSNKIRAKISDRATGTSNSMKNITKNDILGLPVIIAKKQEQEKIASFLFAVDKKIEKLEEKTFLLEKYKKGMMQKLFSQEIRFKADDGSDFPDWEEKKLNNIATFFSGGTPKSTNKDYYRGSIPFIGSGKINSEQVEQFITQDALENSSAKLVNKGDLLYALYGATSGEVAISKIGGAINQAVLCIRSKELISFLFYWLSFNKEKIILKYLQGGQGNLSAHIIKNLDLNLPSEKEQQKIANFLSSLDKKIEATKKQKEKAVEFKKGLLQQMFV